MPKSKDADGKGKTNTSLRLDKKKIKKLKMIALKQDTSVQRIVEQLIDDYLRSK